jgi:myosin XV
MPPPLVETDPFQRPFMDPYGRAKTVRIGKWRWPPPEGIENAEDFIAFKLRQNQRKTTPQSMQHSSNNGSMDDSRESIEWDKYEGMESSGVEKSKERFKSEPALNKAPPANRVHKRSFDIGAERPIPNSVGKLKLSTEMRQRLEQVTAGHSVRSTTSNRSDMASEKQPVKLDETRKMMLEQQLGGSHMMSVRTQIQRMEASKIQKPFMPLPSVS